MSEKEISSAEALVLLDQLIEGAIPVLAFSASESGAITHIYGFVHTATVEGGLVISLTQEEPSFASYISFPIGKSCEFFTDNIPSDDDDALKYGDSCLTVRRSEESLSLFFTAKPAKK